MSTELVNESDIYQPTVQERRAAKATVYLTDALTPGAKAIAFIREYAASSGQRLDKYSDEQVGWAYAAAVRGVALEDQLDAIGDRLLALERAVGARR